MADPTLPAVERDDFGGENSILSVRGSNMTFLLPIVGCTIFRAAARSTTHYHRINGDILKLYLDKPNARQVLLACSQDHFVPREARKGEQEVGGIAPRRIPVSILLSCRRRNISPPCRMKENDDFGSENCIFDPNL